MDSVQAWKSVFSSYQFVGFGVFQPIHEPIHDMYFQRPYRTYLADIEQHTNLYVSFPC
jgi:hypothetical protein